MRRSVLLCALLAVLSSKYAEAADRVWRLGVLTLADDRAVRSVMLPYLATRGFVEGRNLIVNVRVGTEAQMPALAQAPRPHDPAVSPRGRRRGHRMSRVR
jgi:putative ABC transport system substrate-binding protein